MYVYFIFFPIPQPILPLPVFCNLPLKVTIRPFTKTWQSCFMIGSVHLQNHKTQWKISLGAQRTRGHTFDSGPGRSHMPRSNEACVPQVLRLRAGAPKTQPPSPQAETTGAACHKSSACVLELPRCNHQACKLKLLRLVPQVLRPTHPRACTLQRSHHNKSVHSNPACKVRKSLCKATKT